MPMDSLSQFEVKVLRVLAGCPGRDFAAKWIAGRVWGRTKAFAGKGNHAMQAQSMGAKLSRIGSRGLVAFVYAEKHQRIWRITQRGMAALKPYRAKGNA